jgi:hypothetical protein
MGSWSRYAPALAGRRYSTTGSGWGRRYGDGGVTETMYSTGESVAFR